MKFIVILVILFYQHQNVSNAFSVLNLVTTKVQEFLLTVGQTLREVRDKVRTLFILPRKVQRELKIPERNQKILHSSSTYSNFIKSTYPNIRTTKTEKIETVNFNFDSVPELPMMQLGTLHGKNIESHSVTTADGYILTLHRMTLPSSPVYTNKTVLLHHGLLGSSADWLLLESNKSLPYLLSNAGYDVWLTNARGNYYSRNHVTLKLNSSKFWNFTWQEMGHYDLPAVIDYIRKVKHSNESIYYVGHSMGATALLVLLSTYPNYNKYFKVGILLAPLVFMTDIKGPLKVLSEVALNSSSKLGYNLGVNGELFPSRRIPDWLARKYCKGPKIYCRNPLLFIGGGISQLQTSAEDFKAKFLHHIPAGGSVNTLLHYAQLSKTGKFHKFNDMNSEFNLRNVTLPIAIFSSSEDWLASIPDVVKLYDSIANPIDHNVIRGKNLSHTEFVSGLDSESLVFRKVMELLEHGLKQNVMKTNEV